MEIPNNSKGEHYNLRWNSYTNNLTQVLLEHQLHGNLVDVTLCCEGQFIKAHKLVLSACSEIFQNMFKLYNVQHPMIVLNGIKLNHFQHILEFMYKGEVKVVDVDLEGVLAVGENLQVKGLCSIKLKRQMPSEELKTTALQQNANILGSMPNSLSNSPITTNETILKCGNNGQPMPKNLLPHSRQQARDEENSGLRKSEDPRVKKVQMDDVKKVEMDRVNISPNKNINNKLEHILSNPIEGVQRKRFRPTEMHSHILNSSGKAENRTNENSTAESEKNSRPVSAFMLFANEWRKKLTVEHPDENNKEISVRLGNMWKSLSNETKESYYLAVRKMEMDNKEQYQGYTSSKIDLTKKRKMVRRKTIDSVSHLVSVNLQEYDDNDDLQIIEVNEDPLDVSHFQIKRNLYNKNLNNT